VEAYYLQLLVQAQTSAPCEEHLCATIVAQELLLKQLSSIGQWRHLMKHGIGGQKMANEKRLIDANALMEEIDFEYDLNYGEILIDPVKFADMVDDAPTVDAVEVVRCKDCKHYTEKRNKAYDGHYCERIVEFVQPNDFCSYGEKRYEK
jgi:hypothetical protein